MVGRGPLLILAAGVSLTVPACTPSGAADPPPAEPVVAPAPPPGPPAPLYGFWGLNGYVNPEGFADVRDRFGINGFMVASEKPAWAVGTLLPMVRDAGLRVNLRLAGDHPAYTVDGDFRLELWKDRLREWDGAGLEPFIADGTLHGHMLLDDITNFQGHDPTAAELEEMARFSKELFPGLMTFVRQKATWMPTPEGGRYLWVDAAVNQYESKDGPVEAYASAEAARAEALGLGIINGLNIADGGDGSSGRAGWRPKHHPMTADEIRANGRVLATVPGCGMFLNWEYDALEEWSDGSIGAPYFDQPELRAALVELGELFAQQPVVPLLKDSPEP